MIPIKICGITRVEDALLAAELGAGAIGFVFYSKSPRAISVENANDISKQLPSRLARVGVFVNPNLETMSAAIEQAQLTHIQLAGDERPELCWQAPLPLIKSLRSIPKDLNEYNAAAFLLDGARRGQYGGTGEHADWDECRKLRERYLTILAGGISADNIVAGVEATQPDAVDLSSSLEKSYGIKDKKKMHTFFKVAESLEYNNSRLANGFWSLG